MNEKNYMNQKQITNHIQKFFFLYFENQDYQKVLDYLDDSIIWMDDTYQITYINKEKVSSLFQELAKQSKTSLQVNDLAFNITHCDINNYLIAGSFKVRENTLNFALEGIHIQFTLVFKEVANSIKIVHLHLSSYDINQLNEICSRQSSIDTNSVQQYLLNATKLLEEKTIELEALTDNIVGGVQVCKFDSEFTIQYVNDGFCDLLGYSRQELESQFNNKHIHLVYFEDILRMQNEVREQIHHSKTFVVEYRMVKKDKSIIWVLDKGTVFYHLQQPEKVQCILTDITKQKQQEEQLRISEKRYYIALKEANLSMFEYNILTKDLQLFENDANLYAVSTTVADGPETLIKIGAIMPENVYDYREMYRKIHAGEPYANCYIQTKDTKNIIRDYELCLTTIYDINQKPIRAIGVKKDVSQLRKLEKEQKFNETMVSDKRYIFEANITTNTIVHITKNWIEDGEINANQTYEELVRNTIYSSVAKEYQAYVLRCFQNETILNAFKEGKRQIVFSYKRLTEHQEYEWYEATMNIIHDELNDSFTIRVYHTNINERKLKEQAAEKEKLLYESMIAKTIFAYEINLSMNTITKGKDLWQTTFHPTELIETYSQTIQYYGNTLIHLEDCHNFLKLFERENLFNHYRKGENEFHYEYRKKDTNVWEEFSIHLYEDPETSEIKGYVYIEDIDTTKKEEIELKYKVEHDSMTDLFNKETTSYLIQERLQKNTTNSQHALLMIDIDYFKNINDTFGHLYGDLVITQTANQIRAYFDEPCIVSRFGGDEFCIFISNIESINMVENKVRTLCRQLEREIVYEEKRCKLTISIGISIAPKDGMTFESLFAQADKALYKAKDKGRNQYFISNL